MNVCPIHEQGICLRKNERTGSVQVGRVTRSNSAPVQQVILANQNAQRVLDITNREISGHSWES